MPEINRVLDRQPRPACVEPKRLIVLSAPRTGTYGLYCALQVLGFKPYHMKEVMSSGKDAMRTLIEGLEGDHGFKKPYGREEFDKWFAEYDAIVEMPFFMVDSIVKAYPGHKFLLVERDPERWLESYLGTIGSAVQGYNSKVFKYFQDNDPMISTMFEFAVKFMEWMSKGEGLTEQGKKNILQHYKDYIAHVKDVVPKEQLTVLKLEDGYGWKEICAIVDVPIPNEPWPSTNKAQEFRAMSEVPVRNAQRRVLTQVSTFMIPLLVVGAWYIGSGSRLGITNA